MYNTDHFEIYYRPDLDLHAERVGREAERAYEHVSFDLVHEALPPRVAQLLWRTVCVLVALALLAALPKLWNFITFLWRERTPALQWRLDYVYACFALFIAAGALRFGWEALRRR